MKTKLDNPVWHSLQETHKEYAIDMDGICFYEPHFCPFGGFTDEEDIENKLVQYSKLTDDFYVVGEKPAHDERIRFNKELACNQMILEERITIKYNDEIATLGSEYRDELFNLVNLVQPGYFRERTSELGTYYGIFKEGKLVAVSGERMKMNDFTEVSAVVTHPDHTGKGYAKELVAFTSNKIFDQNKTPYLHVAVTNTSAIGLYEKLGYKIRRRISFWNFQLKPGI